MTAHSIYERALFEYKELLSGRINATVVAALDGNIACYNKNVLNSMIRYSDGMPQ